MPLEEGNALRPLCSDDSFENSGGRRHLGRPSHRWVDNNKIILYA
jgi:hypothetical protein